MAGQQDPPAQLSTRLSRAFFDRPVLEVAPELLGCLLSHAGVTVRLTEVEAYDGTNDPGSHAFRGLTPRTQVMFGPAGGLYVYFTYGRHWCANLVCGPVGTASAVLLRAGEVVAGHEIAQARRRGVRERSWARGPARLAATLALGRDQNGLDTTDPDGPFVVRAAPAPTGPSVLRTGPRVGVSGAGGDAAAYPWRFWVDGEASVSTYRPGRRRSPRGLGPRG